MTPSPPSQSQLEREQALAEEHTRKERAKFFDQLREEIERSSRAPTMEEADTSSSNKPSVREKLIHRLGKVWGDEAREEFAAETDNFIRYVVKLEEKPFPNVLEQLEAAMQIRRDNTGGNKYRTKLTVPDIQVAADKLGITISRLPTTKKRGRDSMTEPPDEKPSPPPSSTPRKKRKNSASEASPSTKSKIIDNVFTPVNSGKANASSKKKAGKLPQISNTMELIIAPAARRSATPAPDTEHEYGGDAPEPSSPFKLTHTPRPPPPPALVESSKLKHEIHLEDTKETLKVEKTLTSVPSVRASEDREDTKTLDTIDDDRSIDLEQEYFHEGNAPSVIEEIKSALETPANEAIVDVKPTCEFDDAIQHQHVSEPRASVDETAAAHADGGHKSALETTPLPITPQSAKFEIPSITQLPGPERISSGELTEASMKTCIKLVAECSICPTTFLDAELDQPLTNNSAGTTGSIFSIIGVPVNERSGESVNSGEKDASNSTLWFLLHVDERHRFVYAYDFCPSLGLQHHVRTYITDVMSKALQFDKPPRVIPTSPVCLENAKDSGYMVVAAACYKAAGFDIPSTEDCAGSVTQQQGVPSFAQEVAHMYQELEVLQARAKQCMELAAAHDDDPPPSAVGPMEVFRSLAASAPSGEVTQRIAGVLQLLEDIEGRDGDQFAKYVDLMGDTMKQLSGLY
ncbi:uncharacterized protein F5Z01DRAFT_635223 [Emericellopsis atlantica]|uniref:Uncharacterized protein n=1 Tax=Emericellopsis atlantica TaxID=2614577 RepID=A0A9P7ZP32_9HYPO|nr:uncharacterized protein F5Z01DRAFT_635223 [Emericellopsis atlantica]KAG9255595.1 hypothetical protein F5Z01DRAFT_635223 [Emericellopsis atlantica]